MNKRKDKFSLNLAGIKMKNPIMAASGTFGYGLEYENIIDLNKLGALVTKTITLKPRQGNPQPRTLEVKGGMINSIGLQNVGVEIFLNEKLIGLKKYSVPIIVSIAGETIDEYKQIALCLKDVKTIAGLEINISCPNVKKGALEFASDLDAVAQIIKNVKRVCDFPVITKLSPFGVDIKNLAKTAVKAGADIISLINTIPALGFYHQQNGVLAFLKGGLSGPAIKPIALRCVMEVRSVVKCPIIGMGGIMNLQDALEFFNVGANAVAVGTANFIDPLVTIKIIEDLKIDPVSSTG